MKHEYRAFPFEVRAKGDSKVSGYAAVFEELSDCMWGFREKIARGAFSKTLKDGHDIFGLWAHDASKPLASRSAGSLTLTEDERGLAFDMTLGGTSWAADAYRAIDSGVVRHMSFGFRAVSDTWEMVNKEEIRTIREAELFEISPVVFPAYPTTSVEARSAEEAWQRHLAEAGAASNRQERRGDPLAVLLALNANRLRTIR